MSIVELGSSLGVYRKKKSPFGALYALGRMGFRLRSS